MSDFLEFEAASLLNYGAGVHHEFIEIVEGFQNVFQIELIA